MENSRNIAVMRGGGIGFLLASLVFVFTWNPWVLVLVPLGAVVGYIISLRPPAQAGAAAKPSNTRLRQGWESFIAYLGHPNLFIRFFSLLLLGSVLFLLAWIVGYYLLPEAAFRSGAEAQLESRGLGEIGETVTAEFWGIFLSNLLPAVLIVLANLVLRVNGIPFGYIIPLYNIIGYGLFIGTNSFLIPYPERLAPTFAILERSGPYEMAAFVIVATATATWSIYEVKRLFQNNATRVEGAPRIAWVEVVFLLLGVALLAGAAWREAVMIIS